MVDNDVDGFRPLSINVLCVPFVMIYFALFFEMTGEQDTFIQNKFNRI